MKVRFLTLWPVLFRSRIGFRRLSQSYYTDASTTDMGCHVLFHDPSHWTQQSGRDCVYFILGPQK